MTRKLPWKRDSIGGRGSATRPSPSTAGQRPKADGNDSDVESRARMSSLTSAAAARRKARRPSKPLSVAGSGVKAKVPERSTSTSPPPEPVIERYMLEGLDQDDQYRMVEDEFYAIAQKFTAHLHRAEYERLKTVAKAQNADTIRNISRPVVGSMTDLVRKRQEQKLRAQRQRQAIREASAKDGDSEDNESERDDDTWHGSALYGLMESPRKKAPRLDRFAAVSTSTTRTRAAAGYGGSQEANQPLFNRPRPSFSTIPGLHKPKKALKPQGMQVTEDDDDDLDAPTHRFTWSLGTHLPPTSIRRSPSSLPPPRATLHDVSSAKAKASSADVAESESEPASPSDNSDGGLFGHLKRRRAQYKSRCQRKSS